jgi:SAM-dependent methyltransferase/DNA-binding transcriptional ArsR family regulator
MMATGVEDHNRGVAADREALRQLVYGYQRTQILRAAAKLRLADHLAAGALPLTELASRADVSPAVLRRLLNRLIGCGVVARGDDDRYRLTPVGEGLREDVPGSLASLAVLSGEEYYRAWLGFDEFLRDGETPFDRVHGAPLFDWYQEHPALGERFNRRMAARVGAYAPLVVSAVDLSAARRIVDVGGGLGILLSAFLERWPQAHGVLFDLPSAVGSGEERIAAAGLSNRVESVGGDFFREVPAGGDVYILSQILHDWDDDRATTILRTIRRASRPDGRLLIVELLMPEHVDGPDPVVDVDLVMLVLTGGQERFATEYRDLLARSGWKLHRVHEGVAPGGMAVLEATPA